jgi:hypothetical protein
MSDIEVTDLSDPIMLSDPVPRHAQLRENSAVSKVVFDVLPTADFRREELPFEARFVAGKAFLAYRRRGGEKRAALPDFHIGAHFAVRRYRLLTREAARYCSYFPTVKVLAPEPTRRPPDGKDERPRPDQPGTSD